MCIYTYISLHELWNLLNFTFLVKLSNDSHCITFTGALLDFTHIERKAHVNVMKREPLLSFTKTVKAIFH